MSNRYQMTGEGGTIEEGSHKLHVPHLIIRWSARGTNLIKYFFAKAFLDVRVLCEDVERIRQEAHRLRHNRSAKGERRTRTPTAYSIAASHKQIHELAWR